MMQSCPLTLKTAGRLVTKAGAQKKLWVNEAAGVWESAGTSIAQCAGSLETKKYLCESNEK